MLLTASDPQLIILVCTLDVLHSRIPYPMMLGYDSKYIRAFNLVVLDILEIDSEYNDLLYSLPKLYALPCSPRGAWPQT